MSPKASSRGHVVGTASEELNVYRKLDVWRDKRALVSWFVGNNAANVDSHVISDSEDGCRDVKFPIDNYPFNLKEKDIKTSEAEITLISKKRAHEWSEWIHSEPNNQSIYVFINILSSSRLSSAYTQPTKR